MLRRKPWGTRGTEGRGAGSEQGLMPTGRAQACRGPTTGPTTGRCRSARPARLPRPPSGARAFPSLRSQLCLTPESTAAHVQTWPVVTTAGLGWTYGPGGPVRINSKLWWKY